MKKKIGIILVSLMLLSVLAGCIEVRENETTTITCAEVTENAITTKVEQIPNVHWYEPSKKRITGNVIKLEFNRRSNDVIVFEDGFVLVLLYSDMHNNAENYHWQIGKIHEIVVVDHSNNLLSVQILREGKENEGEGTKEIVGEIKRDVTTWFDPGLAILLIFVFGFPLFLLAIMFAIRKLFGECRWVQFLECLRR